jgi:hypothetical protein
MNYWIVSSMHSRDEQTQNWDSKWTVDNFVKFKKFFPSKHKKDFCKGDRCILKVFKSMNFIADFKIDSGSERDKKDDVFYKIDDIKEWDFPVNQRTLPIEYTKQLGRNPSIKISENVYYELLGIRNFTQNLRINYKDILNVRVSEKDLENLLDVKNPLRSIGLEIVERQLAVTPGNIIDLLCKDAKGDYVVVELKKRSANETIGQLARYVTDVKEIKSKAGQKVRGIILALDVDEQLIKAARGVDFDVVLYQLTLG